MSEEINQMAADKEPTQSEHLQRMYEEMGKVTDPDVLRLMMASVIGRSIQLLVSETMKDMDHLIDNLPMTVDGLLSLQEQGAGDREDILQTAIDSRDTHLLVVASAIKHNAHKMRVAIAMEDYQDKLSGLM